MRKSTSGFTIIELLIVIVVIAILATVSVVAYNGVQRRAQDSKRATDIAAIQKALEMYKVDNGRYPPTGTTGGVNCPNRTGYNFSTLTDGSWLKALKDGGYLANPPVDPINDDCNNYSYLYVPKTNYSCNEPSNYYVIIVQMQRNATITPASATKWQCGTVYYPTGPTSWVFTGYE